MTALFESREQAGKAADKLKVYAQPQRLMILSCLLRGELTVGEIDAATGIGQPALSQQLAELRRNELVTTRRASKQIWYQLADEKVCLCVRSMEAILGDDPHPDLLVKHSLTEERPQEIATPAAGAAGFARII
ncbi:MAG: helix-turn-helix transcriptional regulator [Sphingorhabdus sp.]|jgi:DNA-binding transcriptional ArsR family regulator|uniref:ArsR/SmtB family transcription factor n=1 Tax=Sphingorhabdus sp. TaxID=1902408 RepID=UPI0025E01359|nr:metalloregulator ArsR/SmtB family transcription factor [Sphingorhabdus sp.]MCO4092951.1 helix-turn-helix transcriptional regulator [Sphingorhabdus sp.]